MIDPKQNAHYKIGKMPELSIHQPKNLNEIINLSDLLMNFNHALHRRGVYFVTAITLIYSLQATYICI